MLHVVQSNETESLIEVLASRLPNGPFRETTIIVPNRAKERFVETSLARHRKVLANVRFARLETWLSAHWEASLLKAGTPHRILGTHELEVRLLEVLSRDALRQAPSDNTDELDPVRRYLAADPVGARDPREQDRRIAELAARLSHLYAEYTFSRPSWIRAWMRGEFAETETSPLERWQRALYLQARAVESQGAPVVSVAEVLEMEGAWEAAEPVIVFGLSYVAEAFQRALGLLAERVDVHVYAINPCREFWADAETPHESRRRRRGPATEESEDDNSLLKAWGRPGREHVGVLDELTGFAAEDAFVNRSELLAEPTLLQRVQSAILERKPVAESATDSSVIVLPCPSVRREVESVKQLIWGWVASQAKDASPLRFSEIAVLVQAQSRDLYLPHIESVFGETTFDAAHHLPWSAQDLQLGARSRVAEAVLRLLRVLHSPPTRRELLGLASHSLVHRAFEDADPAAWARMLRDAGVVRGADERDLEGTYVDAASGVGGVLHFDQGLSRLALLAAGHVDEGDDAQSELRMDETMDLVRFMRSVLADQRAVARGQLTLSAWGALLGKLARAYVKPESRTEQGELDRCAEALQGIGTYAVKGPLFGSEVPLFLAEREVDSIPAVKGDPQSLGVVVASLLPMRAIPFRVVFVLGLGEGLFPVQRTEGGLDLRTKHRRAGDVSPEERDRYAFLEALLSTREKLVLSYVARDGETGDALEPATVIHELKEASGGLMTCTPPQRRDRTSDGAWLGAMGEVQTMREAALAAMPEALREETARERGDRERVHFRDYEVESEAWASFAPTDVARTTFAIPVLPEAPLATPVRVNLSVLRKFLRCPIQGRAELSLRQQEDDESFLGDEEPLDADALATRRVAEAALFAMLAAPPGSASPSSREAILHAQHLLVREGEFPLGVLGEAPSQRAQSQLEDWLASLREARGARTTHALPLRLGGVARLGEHAKETHEVKPALTLTAMVGALQTSWLLEGRTRAFVKEARTADVIALVSGKQGGERGQLARLEALLMAFLDHVVLAALGEDNTPRRALLLTHDGPYVSMLQAIPRGAAERWLKLLLIDLIRERDVHFMPIEAVLLEEEIFRRGGGANPAERLLKSIERVRTKYEGGASRYGPIRDAVRFEPPEMRAIVKLVGTRFGPFFQLANSPVRVTSEPNSEGLLR